MDHGQQSRRDKLADRLRKVEHGAHSAARKLSLHLQPADTSFLTDRDTYTYEFKPAPDQDDPVRDLIEEIISKLSDNSLRGRMMSRANIRVRPTTTEIPLWPRRRPAPLDPHEVDDEHNTKLYTFFQEMEEFPATITIRFHHYCCPLEPEKLQVQHSDQWVPITDWLVQLADASYFDRRNASLAACFWFNRGDQHFCFLDLPMELRLAIYDYVIAPDAEIYPISKAFGRPREGENVPDVTVSECENAHIVLGIGYCRDDVAKQEGIGKIMRRNKSWSKELRHDIQAPDTTLFFVSKRVHAEASQAAWERPTRCFIDHCIFAAVAISKVGVSTQYNVLGRVELSFTCRAWFRFFGINQVLPTIIQDGAASLGPSLERLPSACRLTIRFRNPDDGFEVCDPFCDPWKRQCDRSSCQTELNTWIMTFVFKHIKHIQHLDITGYIRKLQRKRILAAFQHRHDQEWDSVIASRVEDILNTPSYKL